MVLHRKDNETHVSVCTPMKIWYFLKIDSKLAKLEHWTNKRGTIFRKVSKIKAARLLGTTGRGVAGQNVSIVEQLGVLCTEIVRIKCPNTRNAQNKVETFPLLLTKEHDSTKKNSW